MTDKIKDWKLKLIIWLEKRQVKEKQDEIENFKDSVFNKINEEYRNLMLKRLARVTKEKFDLEQFLSVGK